MVPGQGLKPPSRITVRFGESAFPVGDPVLQWNCPIVRRAEKMHMIRHQDVSPNQPGVGRLPDIYQQPMHLWSGQPGPRVFSPDGHENEIGFTDPKEKFLRRLAGPVRHRHTFSTWPGAGFGCGGARLPPNGSALRLGRNLAPPGVDWRTQKNDISRPNRSAGASRHQVKIVHHVFHGALPDCHILSSICCSR